MGVASVAVDRGVMMAGPLSGLVVFDTSWGMPGGIAGMFLGF